MGRGYRGSDVLLDLELSYEYMGHRTEEWNDIANLMEINLRHATTDLSYLKTDFTSFLLSIKFFSEVNFTCFPFVNLLVVSIASFLVLAAKQVPIT